MDDNATCGPGGPCYFLEILPRELRDQIYTDALGQSDDVIISSSTLYPIEESDGDVKHFYAARPALLHTSKQIRSEAQTIYYANNVFRAPLNDLELGGFFWLANLGNEQRQAVRKVVLQYTPTEAMKKSLDQVGLGFRNAATTALMARGGGYTNAVAWCKRNLVLHDPNYFEVVEEHMLTLRKLGFDLGRLVVETEADTEDAFSNLLNKMWRESLEWCTKAASEAELQVQK